MSDYSNTYGGAAKDSANSIILAADIDTQLDAVAVASATKLDTLNLTTAIESATDSNVFTDADHTKLNGTYAGRVTATVGSGTVGGSSGFTWSIASQLTTITHNMGTVNYTAIVTHVGPSGSMSTSYIVSQAANSFVVGFRSGMDGYSGSGGVAVGQNADHFGFIMILD